MTWTEPGAFEVAAGVYRIPLPLPQDGLRAVNVYVIDSDDGLVLIDGGWAVPAGREALVAGLAVLDAGLADVSRFLVTHVHRDHYTQAVVLGREVGATVCLGSRERATLAVIASPDHLALASQVDQLRRLGAQALAATIAAAGKHHRLDLDEWADPDAWLLPGDVPLAGGRVLEAVETPGHTTGHLVFHDLAAGLLFAGDHVLPSITPSIGYEPVETPDPLGDFLRSLALVRSRPDALLLPAHGQVAASVHARVDELIAHHGTRLDEVQAAVAGTGHSAADVAAVLVWTRRGRTFDELDAFNQMLAIFETGAHLDLLAAQGAVVRELVEQVRRYR